MLGRSTKPANTDARGYLAEVRSNAAEIETNRALLAATERDVIELRERRGEQPDPELNRQISKKAAEAEILADRAVFLERTRTQLRLRAGSVAFELNRSHDQAIDRTLTDFRARMAEAAANLAELVAEGLMLGSAGLEAVGQTSRATIVPDPGRPYFPMLGPGGALLADGRLKGLEIDPSMVSENGKKAVAELAGYRALAAELDRIISAVAAEERARIEAEDRRRKAARPLMNSGQIGIPPAPPDRVAGNKLFPRVELAPGTMFPDNPERQSGPTAGHMYPDGVQRAIEA